MDEDNLQKKTGRLSFAKSISSSKKSGNTEAKLWLFSFVGVYSTGLFDSFGIKRVNLCATNKRKLSLLQLL